MTPTIRPCRDSTPRAPTSSASGSSPPSSSTSPGSRRSATYTIGETTLPSGLVAPLLERGHDRHIEADDVVADRETRGAKEEAIVWLRELLADGPMPSPDVIKRAREDGISERTLNRAKR